ncbi:MAG TPA: GDP-mannose 4,6-dehydratase [Nitriliruptorales bacterium]|nr:GDP-mannose 4,6-dehydratase [Nitriliruptorales bacterium]
MKRALITGITGQDGSYLTELLLDRGYEVHGIIRRSSSFNTHRIDHLYQDPHEPGVRLFLHYGDLTDGSQVARRIRLIEPDEIYNLAAQSHVAVSFEQPEYTGDVDGLGTVRLLEAIREAGVPSRLYQAGTSEMFGATPPPQREDSPFAPRSPYAAAKLYAYWLTRTYREAYGMYAVTGILFNHESERRGETFVTRKVTRAVARILAGFDDKVYLGNLDARRDWGHARDFVRAMWLMLQQDEPRDYVIGTGRSHTVRELCGVAFGHVGLAWEPFVAIDPRYYRPTDVESLCADPSRAEAELDWRPQTTFRELIEGMVEADLAHVGLTVDGAREIAAERFKEGSLV